MRGGSVLGREIGRLEESPEACDRIQRTNPGYFDRKCACTMALCGDSVLSEGLSVTLQTVAGGDGMGSW